MNSIEDFFVGNRYSVFEVLIVLQNFVNVIGKGLLFRIEDRMDNGLRMHKANKYKEIYLDIRFYSI